MDQPLDYFTPRRPGGQDPPAEPRAPRAAPIPIEFDAVLLHTTDYAAARAIENELDRHDVRYFRTEGAATGVPGVELHVRSADHVRAAQFAGMIFARRRRLNEIAPRPVPPRDMTSDGANLPGSSD